MTLSLLLIGLTVVLRFIFTNAMNNNSKFKWLACGSYALCLILTSCEVVRFLNS